MNVKLSSIDDYLNRVSNLFLVLLYPGFAIYNTIIAYGYIPPVLGGFYGPVSIIYLICVTPALLRYKIFLSKRTGPYIYLVFIFFMLISFIAFSNYYLNYSSYVKLAFFQTIEAVTLIFSVFFLGFFIKLNRRLYKIFIFSMIVSLLLILIYVIKTGEVFFYAKQISVDSGTDSVSSYQGFARSAMMIAFISLAMTSKLSKYMAIYLISICILFFLGARSELVGVVFAAGLIVFLKFKIDFFRILQLFVFLLIIIAAIYLAYDKFSSNRIFQLVDISDASSWISREAFESIAINQIKNHPFLGYFAGHIIEGGSIGAYSHNILSVWAGFGFIAFLVYSLVCLIPVIDLSISAVKKKKQTDQFYLCLMFSFFVVLLIVFAKPVFWFVPGFVWGMYLNVRKNSYER